MNPLLPHDQGLALFALLMPIGISVAGLLFVLWLLRRTIRRAILEAHAEIRRIEAKDRRPREPAL